MKQQNPKIFIYKPNFVVSKFYYYKANGETFQKVSNGESPKVLLYWLSPQMKDTIELGRICVFFPT